MENTNEEIEREKVDKFINFTQKGIELEKKLWISNEKIREKSIDGYNSKLTDSRLILLSVFYELMLIREGVSIKTTKSISNRINLVATYVQGVDIVEKSISEGQYTKASALLKQDYEILTRIIEVKNNLEKEGKTPQVKNLPKEFRRFYSYLNKISHPSNSNIIESLITKIDTERFIGISFIPIYKSKLSNEMYNLNLIIMYNILLENIVLIIEMYGKEIITELNKKGIIEYAYYVKSNLFSCGLIKEK